MADQPDLEGIRASQDAVMDTYKSGYRLTDTEASDLHMFFSPHRVPIGLTYKEVRIVLLLFPLRDTERSKNLGSALRHPTFDGVIESIALPEELIGDEQMTRLRFKAGIWKMLEQAASRERLQ